MKEVTVGDQKVLLVCTRGQYSAVGNQCSHYNAPLVKGNPQPPHSEMFYRTFNCVDDKFSFQEYCLVTE